MVSGGSEFTILLIVFLLIGLVSFIITVAALIDIVKSEFKGNNDKLVWILLTILVSPIGGILYFIIGRQQKIGA